MIRVFVVVVIVGVGNFKVSVSAVVHKNDISHRIANIHNKKERTRKKERKTDMLSHV